jgi:ParB family chromosome partitioning protein
MGEFVREIGTVKEPLMGYEQRVFVVPVDRLKVIDVQRRPSTFHVRRLGESMRKIGFISPLVAVKKGEDFVVIDGQQRLLAAKELGIKELPCIVVPEKYAMNLMELNVEKQMSLREKAYVALNIYRSYLHESPQVREDDPTIMDSIEMPYYVTLGMSYEKDPKLFGSAYEAILKKIDGFLSLPLQDAARERESRSSLVVEAEEIA